MVELIVECYETDNMYKLLKMLIYLLIKMSPPSGRGLLFKRGCPEIVKLVCLKTNIFFLNIWRDNPKTHLHSTTFHSCHKIGVIKPLNYDFIHSEISPTPTLFPSLLLSLLAEICCQINCIIAIKALIQRRKVGGALQFTRCCHGESR